MAFVSDLQRKHFFANSGPSGSDSAGGGAAGGSGGGVPTFPEMSSAQMDAKENDYAAYWAESENFVRNTGFKNPMPK